MKKILPLIIVGVIVIGLVFFAGYKIGTNKATATKGSGPGEMFTGEVPGGGMGVGAGSRGSGMNFTNGEIISKDDTSITIKSGDSGSKIVFYSGSTEISKFASGTINDLAVGDTIMVTGTTNSDGSVTAKTIQLRPVTDQMVRSETPTQN